MNGCSVRSGPIGYSRYPSSPGWPVVRSLIIGFFVLIALISLKTLIDTRNLSEFSANLSRLPEKEIPEIHITGVIRSLISNQETIMLKLLLDKNTVGQAKQEIVQLNQQISEQLKHYEGLHQELMAPERIIIARLRSDQQTLIATTHKVFEFIENERYAEAEKIFLSSWENLHHTSFESLDLLLNFEVANITDVTYQTEQLISSARFFSLFLAAVSLFLSGLLIVLLITSFSRSIDAILLAMEQVLRGETISQFYHAANKKPAPLIRRFNEVLTWLYGSFEDSCHELRTSLTVIRGEAEVALRSPQHTSVEDYRESLQSIASVAQQMGTLVDDLVFLGRSQIGQIDYEQAPVDMSTLLTAVVRQCQGLATLKKIQLTTDIEQPVMISGDFQRLRQVFVILLDNAIKYTDAGGQVCVKLTAVNTQIRVAITDSGLGIREQDLPHIFERFYRAASGRPRPVGGSGLGLAIAKSIVQAQQGEIIVESQLNAGTTMTVVFSQLKSNNNATYLYGANKKVGAI